MSTPDGWRRPDHWKFGDPARYRIVPPPPKPESGTEFRFSVQSTPEPRFDWQFVVEALVLAVVVFGAIVVMSTQ